MEETRLSALAGLARRGVLDPELAALVALLVGVRVPVIVAAEHGEDREEVVDALLALLPDDARVVELAGPSEEFEWLPEATELGWRRERAVGPANHAETRRRASSSDTVLLARDLAGTGPSAIAGPRARVAIRVLALGYGLIGAIDAVDLETVINRLHAPDIGIDEDERSRLGVVLAVGHPGAGTRVLAAHYLRPLARDQHGHPQRMPPAVLATWNMAGDRWDHFAWGLATELAERLGVRPIDLEREQARLAGRIRALSASTVD